MMNRARSAVVAILMAIVVSAPMMLRARNRAAVEREYDAIELGESLAGLNERAPKLRFARGVAPARYQNYVWWSQYGDRESTTQFAVRHGDLLAANVAYVVGVDESGRVAYKAIGNT
jgi:hypothetical protein